MKILNILLGVTLATSSLTGHAQSLLAEIEPVNAPFDMPLLTRPVIPEKTLSIVKTGAKQGVKSTKAIQKAIDNLALTRIHI